MPKLKTSKSASKRFKISSKGKRMRRPVNSGHFNAKDSGTERRKKLGTINTNASNENDLANLFPYA
ncbi:MAG: 50S ribosomal protein L35 [Patescibacteria group bacterium]